GLSKEDVVSAPLKPQTRELIEHFREQATSAPLADGLATLYAYEGQVPQIAWQKIKGLTDHYGFTPDGFEFFSVHLVSDIARSGAEVAAIEEACEDEDAVVHATEVACDRLLAFLDGCYEGAV